MQIWIGSRLTIARLCLALWCICIVGINQLAWATDAERIVVLISHQARPYENALAGLQHSLHQNGLQRSLDVQALEGNATKAMQSLREVRTNPPRLLITLGTLATQFALKERLDIPMIAGLVLNTEVLAEAPHTTGVALEFPVITQLEWLQRIMPKVKRIGVLYSPSENQNRIESATRAARQMGLSIEAEAVHSPRDIPVALDRISKRVDVLWGVVDSLVLTPQTAKHILLFSFRNKIPFVGLSPTWVKSGALYSLDWDYHDLGRQCSELALKVLSGTQPRTLSPVQPRTVRYVLNRRTARHMKVNFPRQLIRGAQQIFK